MAESRETLGRSVSCYGVSFELASPHSRWPRPELPAISAQPPQPMQGGGDGNGRWVWIQWPSSRQSSIRKIFPRMQRAISATSSSHFCDLDDVDDTEDEESGDVEAASSDVGRQLMETKRMDEVHILAQEAKSNSARDKMAQKHRDNTRLSIILLDQGLFTVYKLLFVACFTLNVSALVFSATGNFSFVRDRPALVAMWNILALTLCRSEAFLRIVFYLAVALIGRSWVPLFVKTSITGFLQSVGGIHSGCGVSSVAWLVYSLVLALRHPQNSMPAIVGIAWAILSLLVLSCLAAFPLVRHLHHNAFERTHRFAGWTALGLLWAFTLLTISYDQTTRTHYDVLDGHRLVARQEFWFTSAITFFTILPWLTVRKVPVSVISPSVHASLIKFDGGVKAGILGRISRSPLSEWHAFGIISNGKKNHMMLAGAVGDFTKGMVSDPPSSLWVRSVHFAGLPYLVNMYDRAVLVATGSGICVFLSFLLQPCAADVCVVWVTKGVEQNFGQEIKQMMSGHPKEKVIIHDTMVSGRPNIDEMAIQAAKNWKAEVVIVTSNPQGSRDVVRACKAAGFAAFGPIWDS